MNPVRLSVIVCLTVCACLAPGVGAAEEPSFKAGAATSNITPRLGCQIVGNWNSPKGSYIHDELHARCLALDDGEQRVVIVICDSLYLDPLIYDQAKQRLHEQTGIPPAHMLMAATHTHSGPPARRASHLKPPEALTEYQLFVVDRIVDSVLCALHNLEPAQIAWGRGEVASEVNNRRWHMSDPSLMVSPYGDQDQVRMNPPRAHEALVKPAGPTDPEIVFLNIRSVDGRPIALLANYSLHYVGGVPKGHISADYFAVFADRIQELLGADRQDPPFVGILSNGTSADINNINFRERSPKRKPYEQIHHVAGLVANEVHRACETIEYHDHVKLDGRMTTLKLTVRKPDEATLEWARGILAKPDDQTSVRERSYAHRALSLPDSPDEIDARIQALRIGDVGIAAFPFETFVETGLHLKKQSPLPVTFSISHANGGFGYLPTPAQYELGGYETWLGTSRVAVESEPAIVDTLFKQLAELAAE